ncbi:MAG: hypothetical protein PHU64_02610 [Candidatus Omnitrophica bacterium]|nr:hypothetical protein [Candidatus Omnitrophota bacterium]MDD5429391.1 hypothetical protein [Candidatus Omnitrophota bacterium]
MKRVTNKTGKNAEQKKPHGFNTSASLLAFSGFNICSKDFKEDPLDHLYKRRPMKGFFTPGKLND